MRKLYVVILSITVMFGVLQKKENARAATWAFGVVSYYAEWNPAFRGMYDEIDVDPLFMIGPAVSVTSEGGWSFSALLLSNDWGWEKTGVNFQQSFTGTNGEGTVSGEGKYLRDELDLVLSYKVSSFLKIFAGIKLSSAQIVFSDRWISSGSYTLAEGEKNDSMVWYSGGGLGVTLSYPLFSTCSAVMGISALYAKTKYDLYNPGGGGGGAVYSDSIECTGNGVGCNVSMSLAYYIPSINMVVSAGGRYQRLHYYGASDDVTLEDDTLYGLTMSVLFVF